MLKSLNKILKGEKVGKETNTNGIVIVLESQEATHAKVHEWAQTYGVAEKSRKRPRVN